MNEQTKSIQNFFSKIAYKYDFLNNILSFGIHHIWKKKAINLLGLRPGETIIDICGGSGDLSKLSSKAVGYNGATILYDLNWDMIKVGRLRLKDIKFKDRIFFLQGNAEKISFPDNVFDAVIIGFGIRNLSEMEDGLSEMYRILKPNGRIMCLEFSKPKSFLLNYFYNLYSLYLIPQIGWIISGSKSAYNHLVQSIRNFPLPDELSDILKKVGFSKTSYQLLFNGVAAIHIGYKK